MVNSSESFPLTTSDTMLCLLHNSVATHESGILPHNENNHWVMGHVGGRPRLGQHWLSVQRLQTMWTIIYEGFSCKSYRASVLTSQVEQYIILHMSWKRKQTNKCRPFQQVGQTADRSSNTNIQMQTWLICFAKWRKLRLLLFAVDESDNSNCLKVMVLFIFLEPTNTLSSWL